MNDEKVPGPNSVFWCGQFLLEVISGIGIAHMIIRISKKPDSNKTPFERNRLEIMA